MLSLPLSIDAASRRQRGERSARRLALWGAGLTGLLLALPVLDLLRRALALAGAGNGFLWRADSADPVVAGMGAALAASGLALLPVLFVAMPLALGVAVYLEEIARPGRVFAFAAASIRQLAWLPPVVFGLLGFAGLVAVLGLQVGTPLLAGSVLGLVVLPRMALAAQAALRAVPTAVRDAGFAVGASPLRVVSAHVLPAAGPSILGAACTVLARALGEAAPLLLVGFAAFAAGRPSTLAEPGVPLPVTVFRWAGTLDEMFLAKAAAATLLLLLGILALGALGARLQRQGGTA